MQLPQELGAGSLKPRAITWPSTWTPDSVEHIAAVDPGETTGVAILHRQHHTRDTWLFVEIPYDLMLLHGALMYMNQLIVERFTIKSNKAPTANYTALKVIGAIELTAQLQGIPPPTYTQSADIQGNGAPINERWQRDSLLWMPGMVHANDAARHLIHWLIFDEREKAWIDQHARIMRKRLFAV